MIPSPKVQIDAIDASTITPLVRQLLQDQSAIVLDCTRQPLEGGFSGSLLYRFRGQAQSAGQIKRWSVILKVISLENGGQTPETRDYWKREVLLYQSTLLEQLPSDLIAPRCYLISEYEGEEYWLWLEDMLSTQDLTTVNSDVNGAVNGDAWSPEQYQIAANHLGQMNGLYWARRPLPQQTWLKRSDIRLQLARAEAGISQLPQLRHAPSFAPLLTEERVAQIQRLWAERERLLAALERLPQTFCHGDAFRFNLIARRSAVGQTQTVALDWGMAGIAPIGEEIVPLFAFSLIFVKFEIERIPQLDRLIFAGYLEGLRSAGWQGDEKLVRFAFTASAALKTGVADPAIKMPNVARRIAALPPGAELPKLLNPGGYPQEAARLSYLLSLGEEALGFLDDWQP